MILREDDEGNEGGQRGYQGFMERTMDVGSPLPRVFLFLLFYFFYFFYFIFFIWDKGEQ